MDIRLNNEALVSCVIAQVVNRSKSKVSRVTALVPMLLNDGFRNKLLKNNSLKLSDFYQVGMEYREMLVCVMNSIIMLVETKCLAIEGDELIPLENNKKLCESMHSSCGRLFRIMRDMNIVMDYFDNDTIVNNYKKFYISL